MKALDVVIEWNDHLGNSPNLRIVVDELPKLEDLRYEKKGNSYFAEKDGYVNFYVWCKGDQTGYGGRTFEVTMVDGYKEKLKGPWSGNSGEMNKLGFTPCLEVTWKEQSTQYNYIGAVTVDFAREVLKQYKPNIRIEEKEQYGKIYYEIPKDQPGRYKRKLLNWTNDKS